ncbi:MAG TPA: rhomboid family intramembrane serine protease [Longimicrobium sp.]|nr:rhomboid family intramembrane serine protease [Longimicrobium sp.]
MSPVEPPAAGGGPQAAAVPGAPYRPWEPAPPRPKPEGIEYGFLNPVRDELVGTTRERLVYLCRTAPPPRVWTPENDYLVPPYEVPYLLDACRELLAERAGRTVRRTAAFGAGLLALWSLAATPLVLVPGVPLLIAYLAYLRSGRQRAMELRVEELRAGEANAHYARWEASQPAHRTRGLMYMLMATGAAQLPWLRESVAAAGMDPARVLDGEPWRVLSGALLHGSPMHWVMNFSALVSLGRTMEARAPAAYVPLVFLASALTGSLASLYLPPHVVSVGASGGLLGMMGFLLVLALRRAGHLPEGFGRLMRTNLLLTAGIGLVGFMFIDNAAHGGGLLAGVAIGAAAIPNGDRVPEWTGGALLERAGLAAQALLWAATAATAAVILTRVLG